MTREEAIERLKTDIYKYADFTENPNENEFWMAFDLAIKALEQEPKTGHWIFDEILDKHYYCSECKSMGVDYWDFCPSCGAKMVEPQERSDKG